MKLFFSPGACGLASQIALREAGLKFDLIKVDLKAKTTSTGEDYKSLVPQGYIPALQLDNGEILSEGAVILQWVSDQNPSKGLLPAWGSMQRYKAMEWLNFIATELHKGIGSLFTQALNQDGPREAILKKLEGRLSYLEAQLKKSAFLLGDKFSLADAYLFNILRWSKMVKIDLSIYPNITALFNRVAERPSVIESMKAEGLNP